MWSDISKYLDQYKNLFGNELYIENYVNKDVFFSSEGNLDSDIVFIEYVSPSVSKSLINESNKLLNNIFSAVNLSRSKVCILKVSSLLNIESKKMEMNLESFLEVNNFKLIVFLGKEVSDFFVSFKKSSEDKIVRYKKIDIITTMHPLSLLENPNLKRTVWEDFKLIQKKYLDVN